MRSVILEDDATSRNAKTGRVQSTGGVHHAVRGLQEQLRQETLQPVHIQASRGF